MIVEEEGIEHVVGTVFSSEENGHLPTEHGDLEREERGREVL